MAHVTRTDLENASKVAKVALQNAKSNSTAVSKQISSFLTDSIETLKGSGFDYIRSRLYMYQTALDKLCNICENLANNIEAANNKMINDIKGLDLDTTNINELEARVSQIESLISWYSESIVVDDTVSDAEKIYVMRNSSMRDYYTGVLAIIKEQLELLKTLESISNAAVLILDNVESDISNYSNSVSSITVSNIV